MENIIITKIIRRQLDQVVLHEQVENGIAISNNLSANLVDLWFETPRKFLKQNRNIRGQKKDLQAIELLR
jgi:histidinol dehydrogenase